MTNVDALSDALVAALQAVVPVDGLVVDHDSLPVKAEDLPPAGIHGVYLFEDRPSSEDGVTDSEGRHARQATFKVEVRVPGSTHLLHGTRAARRLLQVALLTDPTLGRLAHDARVGAVQVLVSEASSRVAACAVDVLVDYTHDPEAP